MVAKIMKSSGSMKSPLDYNEHKVEEGNAQVVAMMNMDDSLDPLHDTFDRYERGNIRSKEVSFHMSINPGPGEQLSEEQLKAFVGELMQGLGYGDQPFVIYRHNDIDREHYHVVSIRVDSDGKKIPNFLENKNCLRLLEELSEKYGFTVGTSEGEKVSIVPVNPDHFTPEAGNVVNQMEVIATECCSYRFTSMDQFALVMEGHGIEVMESSDRSGNLHLRGLDSDGKGCTKPVDCRTLPIDLVGMCRGRISECLEKGAVPTEDLSRISTAVAASMVGARSPDQFTACLAELGIDWQCIRDNKGVIKGATFVDNVTKSVFNISELRHVGLKTLQKVDLDGWNGKVPEDEVQKQPDFANEVAKGLSLLESLLSNMTGGSSREHEMTDVPKKHKGRRR